MFFGAMGGSPEPAAKPIEAIDLKLFARDPAEYSNTLTAVAMP